MFFYLKKYFETLNDYEFGIKLILTTLNRNYMLYQLILANNELQYQAFEFKMKQIVK